MNQHQFEIAVIKNNHQKEINLIKRNHQEEIEILKRNSQSDRQVLLQQQELHLRALADEYFTVEQAMKQQYQAQLESKMSELSAKDTLISSKSSTIQSLQVIIKLRQALGISSSKGNLSIFSPGVPELTFTECAKTPQGVSGRGQGIVIGRDLYVGGDSQSVLKYCIAEDSWSTLPTARTYPTG